MSTPSLRFSVGLTGLSCAGCAGRVERALNAREGVSASVNLASAKAQIQGESGHNVPRTVVDTIRKTGFDVIAASETLAISGMSCAACAVRIENALMAHEGILTASVNPVAEQTQVTYLPGLADTAAITTCIEQAGYHVQARDTDLKTRTQPTAKAWRREQALWVVAVLFTLPLLIEMSGMLFGMHHVLPAWVQWALATPVQFWCGSTFYGRAWRALRGGGANMDVLIALGTSIAYGYSVFQLIWPTSGGALYFETSAAIITLVLLGKLLESRAKLKTGAAITSLLALQPAMAHVKENGKWQDRAVETLRVGDLFMVRPGEHVPVDGVVVEGASEVNEAMLTGESVPVTKQTESEVFAATQNQTGALHVRATGVGADTALARIVRFVEEAQGSKARVQRLADRVAGVFVPVVIGLAVLTWVLTGYCSGNWTQGLVSAVAVLVIACPCALGLATPTAIMVGTGQGARHGILFRDANALENAQQLTLMVLDKTGTLTEGTPAVQTVAPINGTTEQTLLGLALGMEQSSEHPLGRALVTHAAALGIPAIAVEDFKATVGRGVSARHEGRMLLLGSPSFLSAQGVSLKDTLVQSLADQGQTVVALACEGRLMGYIGFQDRLREGAVDTVRALQRQGMRVVMLTGDNARTAAHIAKLARVDECIAELLPEQKATCIRQWQQEGYCVGMAGDGINDAPALAVADVGFSVGEASHIALDTADVVLMQPRLNGLNEAMALSRATLSKIRQNLFFAFVYNALGIPLAALGLLNPVIAGTAMALSSVSVLCNSLLLRRWKP